MKEQKIMPSKNPCRYARYAEIILYEDASGWQTFKYGKLGELTENIRTFALPFENQTYTFKMNFEYDSWNRIQEMTYPDGEVVHYDYNRGGQLTKVYGTVIGEFAPQYPSMPHDSMMPLNSQGLNGQASLNSLPEIGDPVPLYTTHTYPYIDSIVYNEFEQRSEVFHGNGTHTLYVYDSLRRLLLLQSQTHAGDIMQDILYTYDSVSNITGIVNSAAMLPNGLGGAYSSSYIYDNIYRLAYADGTWQGNNSLYYETSLEYEKNGRISRKVLYANTWLDGNYATENYDNEYHYVNTSQPNTLSYINGDPDQSFEWDLKGNMVFHQNGSSGYERSLCWDEQNRLLGVKDDEQQLSYYLYDANGDRVYKLTGNGEPQNISGEWRIFYNLNNATLYASPYLVATKQGYTKHYYAENERIASRIGGGGLHDLDQPVVSQEKIVEKKGRSVKHVERTLKDCLQTEYYNAQTKLYRLYDWRDSVQLEKKCYWYHPDHLGSSSWITFSDGNAVQHLHYLPWGEDFVNQKTSSFSSMYTFSAKEKDAETGYSYFGSRYYSSDLSIWLSVDPMSDKYPSLSPYTYCANNPVKLVDPNGETWERPEDIDLANSLINHAQSVQKNYDPSSFEYQLLQEGIDGLINMGNDEKTCYTFNKSSTYKGNVTLLDNGTISINYVDVADELDSKLGSAWHEAFHLSRRNNWLKHTPEERRNASTKIWTFADKILGNDNRPNEEFITYYSQLIFCPNSMPKNDGIRISNIFEIENYIKKHYSTKEDHIFEFPK